MRCKLCNKLLESNEAAEQHAGECEVMSGEGRRFYYKDVPKLGNVAVTRHAQQNMIEQKISQQTFDDVLYNGEEEIYDTFDVLRKFGKGICIVILLKPTPDRGAKVVKSTFRVKPQAVLK